MNKLLISLSLVCFLLIDSCSKETAKAAFKLPSEVYTIDKVYDIANTNSTADLRIEALLPSTINTADLVEARLLIVKSAKTLTADQISGIAAGNFFPLTISPTARQIIKPTAFKDTDGDPVVNGTPYKVYIGVVGKEDSRQLSAPKDLTLTNRPILAGSYLGTWEDLGPPGPGSFPITLRIDDSYAAQMFYTATFTPYGKPPATEDVTATLVVNGNTFSFSAAQHIEKYTGGGQFTASGGGCPASKVLTGTVQDDINLVFDTFSWSDCDGTRNVNVKFTRQ